MRLEYFSVQNIISHNNDTSFIADQLFNVRLQNCKKQLLASLCLSVRMKQLGSTGRIFMKFGIEYFSIICQENSSFI